VVDLYNTVVDLPDPSDLTPQAVDEVGSKYGMKMQASVAVGGVCMRCRQAWPEDADDVSRDMRRRRSG
jgi:hypothetical protein